MPTGDRIAGEGWITEMADPELQVQENGVDLTAESVEEITEPGTLDLDNSEREIPEGEELEFEDEIHLEPGAYRVTYGEVISVPLDRVGVILPRSSLMRMGAVIYSALWDAGYEGRGQGLLQVMNPAGVTLKEDARIGQLFFIRAEETEDGYDGRYQGENV